MDIVITYVDGNDPVWKKDYEKYTNVPVMQKRFRLLTLTYREHIVIEIYILFIKSLNLMKIHLYRRTVKDRKELLRDDVSMQNDLEILPVCPLRNLTLVGYHQIYIPDERHT